MSQQSVAPSTRSANTLAARKEWFKVGDEIFTYGQSGIVIGFGEKYIGRGGLLHAEAGTYIDFTNILFAPTDGSPKKFVRYVPMDFTTTATIQKICEQLCGVYIRIGDLPETPFWEGDTVSINDDLYGYACGAWVVECINYDTPDKICTLKTAALCSTGGDGYLHKSKSSDHLQLLARGNIWKLAHGEPLDFTDINEEAKFHQSLGMSQKVRHPITDGNLWEIGDAIKAIARGEGHQTKFKDKNSMAFVLIKYDNEEFGKRMRAHTLKQLGIEAGDTIPKHTQ